MEVASSDDVGLVEVFDRFGRGLDEQFYFFFRKEELPPQSPLGSREEISQCEKLGV